jgi:hypothetical protein
VDSLVDEAAVDRLAVGEAALLLDRLTDQDEYARGSAVEVLGGREGPGVTEALRGRQGRARPVQPRQGLISGQPAQRSALLK